SHCHRHGDAGRVVRLRARLAAVFETLILVGTEFHHSNLRLPPGLDRMLRAVIVTPHLHGIHHSIETDHVSSNFGTVFTWWDRLHGTLIAGVPQERIVIGLPELLPHPELSRWQALALPFRRGQEVPAVRWSTQRKRGR